MNSWPPENLITLDAAAPTWRGGDISPVLENILDAAEQLTPGAHVGICVANHMGTYTTIAGTDPLVFVLDEMQYALDEGPSLTAIREGHTVIVDDAESEQRWPRFIPRAVAVGLRSHLGIQIAVEGKTLGGLNLYSTSHTSLDTGRLTNAKLFAAQAALALGQAQREGDLVTALQSSRTIGKAIGLTMERLALDEHEAFAYLARLSQKANMRLRDIAAHLVEQANDLRQLGRTRQAMEGECSPTLTVVPPLDAAHNQPPQLALAPEPYDETP